jgi:hypothetical protein
MNEEVLTILEDALMPSRRNAETAIAQAEALNREIGKPLIPSLSTRASERGAYDYRYFSIPLCCSKTLLRCDRARVESLIFGRENI